MKIPDRLSMQRGSKFYNQAAGIGLKVSINGVETNACVEYCISAGWARVIPKNQDGTMQRNCLNSGFAIKRVHGVIRVWENK